MDWMKLITLFYKTSSWTKTQVGDAVRLGKITADQYKEITGEDYNAAQ